MSNKKLVKYTLLSALLFLLSISFVKSSFDVLRSKRRLDELKIEITAMDKQAADLQKSIDYKQTDEYVEEKARNDLSLIKPGEEVYVVKGDNSNGSDTSVLGDTARSDKKSGDVRDKNWYSWYRLFFK